MVKAWEKKLVSDYDLVGRTLIFSPTAYALDKESSRDLKRDILLATHNTKFKNIILELSSVEQFEPEGISAVQFAYRQSQLKSGKCVMIQPSSELMLMLKQLKSDKWFETADDIGAAMGLIDDKPDMPAKKTGKPSSAKKSTAKKTQEKEN